LKTEEEQRGTLGRIERKSDEDEHESEGRGQGRRFQLPFRMEKRVLTMNLTTEIKAGGKTIFWPVRELDQ